MYCLADNIAVKWIITIALWYVLYRQILVHIIINWVFLASGLKWAIWRLDLGLADSVMGIFLYFLPQWKSILRKGEGNKRGQSWRESAPLRGWVWKCHHAEVQRWGFFLSSAGCIITASAGVRRRRVPMPVWPAAGCCSLLVWQSVLQWRRVPEVFLSRSDEGA